MKFLSCRAVLLTLTLLISSTHRCHGQGIKRCDYDDCLGCLNDPECGSYYGNNSCYNGCVIADIPCYRTTAAEGSTTPAQVCARYDKNKADAAICSAAPQDCSSCTSTPLSDGNDNCAWFGRIPDKGYCGRPGCTMMGCGDTDPNKCPPGPEQENGVIVEKDCSSYSDCLGCLGDSDCGSWYQGKGCYDRCIIADIPCYKPNAEQTPAQVCDRADNDTENNKICSAKTDCGSCTATPLSDGSGKCAWFGRVAGREYCGRPGCTMMGCGDSDPANCPAVEPPAADGFKLISLGEDDSLCVGIAGGAPMPGKILKLAECDDSNDNMRWKMDARGRIRTKVQYNGASLW